MRHLDCPRTLRRPHLWLDPKGPGARTVA